MKDLVFINPLLVAAEVVCSVLFTRPLQTLLHFWIICIHCITLLLCLYVIENDTGHAL